MSKCTRKGIYSRRRRSEYGNVFFTLFGAVAIVGVLGAGIMATMRGPLSTMVEVNRREQAKAELRVAASLVLVNSDDETCEGVGMGDGYTEGPPPAGAGPTGGGMLPSVGAAQNDPWGNAYGYCAWDHGLIPADYDGCGTVLAGNNDTNNIAIAVMSAGPDGIFQTSCVADAGGTNDYVEPDGGGGDDIVVSMTYNQAISGSGGLWTPVGTDEASINRKLTVTDTGTSTFSGGVDVTGASAFKDVLDMTDANAQLQLGAKSMVLPTQATLPNCTAGNDGLVRLNTASGYKVEVCQNGTGWVPSGSAWSLNGSDIYYTAGQVGIGLNNPDDELDVVGTAQITGATTLDTTLSVGGTSTFDGDVTITGDATGGTTDALSVRDSSASVVFTVQNDGKVGIGMSDPNQELDVNGDATVSGTYMIDGTVMLGNDDVTTNILLGPVASADPGTTANYMNLGNVIQSSLVNLTAPVASTTPVTAIGYSATYDFDTNPDLLNDALEVRGDADISNDLNVTNNLTVGGDLVIPDDGLFMATTNTAGNLLVNDGTNFNPVAMSGDASISSTGALDIGANTIGNNELNAGAASNDYCLKYNAGSLKWEACSASGGGDGLGGNGLKEVLANNNDANSTKIANMADPTLAQDAATKAYVDSKVGSLSQDRIEDTGDQNTYIDVDTADDDSLNTTVFANNGTQSMIIDATGEVGIGTMADPTASLHIAQPTATLLLDGTAGAGFGAYLQMSFMGTKKSELRLLPNPSDPLWWDLDSDGNSQGNLAIYNGGVTIGSSTAAASSAALMVDSTTKGLLTPRMTTAQRDAIGSPTAGLLVFTTDAGDAGIFQFYDGTSWIDVGAGGASGAGIWQEDGTNDYIEYDDTLGGVRIGRVTGQPAPETDWLLDVASSVVYTTANKLAIGSGTVSGTLSVDVTGDVGASQYCDENGNNCFTAASVSGGAAGLWTAGTGDDIYYTSGTPQVGIGTAAPDDTLDVVGTAQITGNTVLGGTLDVTGNTTLAGTLGVGTATPQTQLDTNGTLKIAYGGESCDVAREGAIHYDSGADTFYFCATAGSWQAITLGAGTLAALGDTTISGVSNGDVLYYSGGSWINNALAINDLVDATTNYTSGNMFMGQNAGSAITSGGNNIAIGQNAGSSITTNSDNVFVGLAAGSVGNPVHSIGIGTEALAASNAWGNIGIGYRAGRTNSSGGGNLYLGFQAGDSLTSGDNNIFIGYDVDAPTATTSNYINIGNIFYGSMNTGEIYIGGDGALKLPAGASATRPGTLAGTTAQNGMIRYNSTTDKFEAYQAGSWQDIITGSLSGGAATPDRGIQFNSGGSFSADANFVYTSTGLLGIGTGAPVSGLDVATTDALALPRGTTAQRPGSPINGMIRFNSTDDSYELYSETAADWIAIISGGAISGDNVAGNNGEVQFNSNGTHAGDSGMTYNAATDTLTLGTALHVGDYVRITGQAGNAPTFAALNDLSDVSVAGPSNGEVLYYNTASGNWVAGTITSGGLWTAGAGDAIYYNSGTPRVGIGTTTPDASAALDITSGALGFLPPRMTDPGTAIASPATGLLAFNSTSNRLQIYDGSSWNDIATGNASAANPDRGIQFNSGGNFAADANFTYTSAGDFVVGSSQIDDTGTGTEDSRMYFDVSNSAFRAGSASAGQWDFTSAGQYSVAFGDSTEASGDVSSAFGDQTRATGYASFAAGQNTLANSQNSTAFGYNTRAQNWGSFAVGSNVTASGWDSFATGQNTIASGWASSALGQETVAQGINSFALGLGDPVAGNSVVSGDRSLGIFMGAQDNVTLASTNTMGLFGGSMVIDPAIPATNLSADTAFEVEGTIKMAYGGEACDANREGAIHYDSGADTFYFCANQASGWEAITLGSGTLAALSDTTISGPTNGDILYYSSSGWINHAMAINDLSDGTTNYTSNSMYLGQGAGTSATGTDNTVLGTNATLAMTTGVANTAIGGNALRNIGAGGFNTAVGSDAQVLLSGNYIFNVALGYRAAEFIEGGNGNTILGAQAARGGAGSPAIYDNVIIGNDTARYITTNADHNVLIGSGTATSLTSGADNILIGYDIEPPLATTSNYINIGDIFYGSMSTGELYIGGDGALALPAGDSTTRPGTLAGTTAQNGMIRYNSTSDRFEGYQAGSWQDIVTGSVVGGAANPDRGIQFNSGGSFAAAANFTYTSAGDFVVGSYQLDDTGTGSEDVRMFFDASQGAFRAGYVAGTEWDSGNIGQFSFAGAENSIASGQHSFAFGDTATAGANNSFALGTLMNVTGTRSFGLGLKPYAAGTATLSADQSFAVFMGNQSGVNVTTNDTLALLGGSMVIDPNQPATNLVPDTAFEVEGTIKMAYGGEACDANREGAIHYDSGADTFYFCANQASGWEAVSLGSSTVAGGSDGQVQYNSGGSLAGEAGFTYDDSNDTLTVAKLSATDRVALTPKSSIGTPNGMAVNDLSDVDVTGVSDGEFLVYNNGTGNWEASAIGSQGGLWTAGSGDDIYYNSGTPHVGIGDTSPDAELDIESTGPGIRLGDTDAVSNGNTSANITFWNSISQRHGAVGFFNNKIFTLANDIIGGTVDLVSKGNISIKTGDPITERISIDTDGTVRFQSTGAIVAPRGDTAERPTTSENGMIRYNSQTDKFEGYQAGSWQDLITSAVGAGGADTQVQFNNAGSLDGDAGMTYSAASDTLTIGSGVYVGSLVNIGSTTGAAAPTGVSGTVNLNLDDLGDVTASGPSDGNVLYYSAGAGGWLTGAVPSGSGGLWSAGSGDTIYYNSGTPQVVIGATSADASAALDITSSTLGLLPPRNTDPGTNISSPAAGLVAYDTTDNELQLYDGSSWVNLGATGSNIWSNSGAGYIEYDSTMGGMKITSITGAAAPSGAVNPGMTPSSDTVDWAQIVNSMTLDATTSIDMDTNSADLNFDANTFVIYSSNNSIGIGTAIPDSSAVLDISSSTAGALLPRMNGTDRDAIASPASGLIVYNSTTNTYDYYDGSAWTSFATSAGSTSVVQDADGNTKIQVEESANEDYVRFDTAGTERMVIAPGGNIGMGTASPSSTLDVIGDVEVSNYVKFTGVAGNAPTYITDNGLWTAGSGDAIYYSSGTPQVGIGTTTPDASAIIDISSSTAGALLPRMDTTDRDAIASPADGLIVYNSTTATYDYYNGSAWTSFASSAGSAASLADTDGDTQIQVEESADEDIIRFDTLGTERMIIDSSGNVGIGASSPANELDVSGDIRSDSLILNSTTGNAPTYITDNGLWTAGSGDAIYYSSGSPQVGIGTTTPDVELDVVGDIEYTGTITDVSDRRLKDNIEPLNKYGSLLERIEKIETVSFVMKDDKAKRTEFGVIAQQLETVFPELVHTANDEMGTKSVNYVGLIAPMIEATKELKAENESLKTQLNTMQAEKQDVKQAVASLQQQVDLLNKAAGQKVGKASMVPTAQNWLYMLLGMLGTLCIVLIVTRKTAKTD